MVGKRKSMNFEIKAMENITPFKGGNANVYIDKEIAIKILRPQIRERKESI